VSKIVARTLDFLELFAEHKRPLSNTEIARLLGIPYSSCHDVLHALEQRGYLYELTARGGFYPTLRVYEIAKAIAANDPVVLRTADRLHALRDAIDESVLLSKIDRLQATYLLSLEPRHPLRFLARVGDKVRSLHATSAGKALLGGLSPEELEAHLKSSTLRAFTPRSIVSKPALRRDLAAGRERGWYLNDEESLAGVTTISSRFRWALASYVVTIAGPSSRMNAKLENASQLLTDMCRSLDSP